MVSVILVGIVLQFPVLNDMPDLVHAWAQADRYAISLKYLENGMNFWQPETFIYNKHFDQGSEILRDTTITSVNFPIHNYIIAILMKVFGTDAPWVFRTYTLCFSFVFLAYVFKLIRLIGADNVKATIVVLFAMFSPVFVYYQGNFMPSTLCLAVSMMGLYYYIKYTLELNTKYLYWGLLLLTVSALSRTTFVIIFLSVLGGLVIRVFRGNSNFRKVLIPVLLSFTIYLFFFFWTQAVREAHDSMFVNHLITAGSIDEFMECMYTAYDNWKHKYFTRGQYWTLLIVVALGSVFAFRKRLESAAYSTFFIGIISSIGCMCFTVAMAGQFPHHDYYFLDTYYLPVLLFFGLALTAIPNMKIGKVNIFIPLFAVLSVLWFVKMNRQIKIYRHASPYSIVEQVGSNFRGSEVFLDEMGVSDAATVMVFNPFGPNIPFVHFKRNGMAVMHTTDPELVKSALQWKPDYLLLQKNSFFDKVVLNYPEILDELKYRGQNEKLVLCKLGKGNLDQFQHLFILDQHVKHLFSTNGFNNGSKEWENLSLAYDSTRQVMVHHQMADQVYGLTRVSSDSLLYRYSDKKSIWLSYTAMCVSDTAKVDFVISLETKQREILFYETMAIFPNPVSDQEVKREVIINLPRSLAQEADLYFYINNPNRAEFIIHSVQASLRY